MGCRPVTGAGLLPWFTAQESAHPQHDVLHTSNSRADRLVTGQTARLGTGNRLGTAAGGPVVSARPLTQQGLAGAKASTQLGRQIQDGQFFYTKLSEKVAQVADANEGLRQELETIEKNRSRQEQLQSRFEELKDEVTTAEVHLRDYNLVLQKAAMQASATDVEDTLRTVNVRLIHLPPCRTHAQSTTLTAFLNVL